MKKKRKKTEEKSEKAFWNVFGKISSIIFVIGGIIAIYSFFGAKKVQLEAECSYSDFELPPTVIKYIQDLQKRSSPENLSKILDQVYPEKKPLSEHEILQRKNDLSLIYNSFRSEDYEKFGSIGQYLSFWIFRIDNSGNLPAEKVVLDIPVTGIATVKKTVPWGIIAIDSPEDVNKEIKNTLELGDIRPGNSLYVLIWSNVGHGLSIKKSIHLSYTSGKGKISFQKVFFGFPACIASNLLLIAIIILLSISLFALFWVLTRKQR